MQTEEIRIWKKVFESDLDYVSTELKELLDPKSLILLEGEMGAGKTTFVRHYLKLNEVSSPTYSIIYRHGIVAHGDLYRLENESEIDDLELDLELEEVRTFFVEWGERFALRLWRDLGDKFSFFRLKIDQIEGDGRHYQLDQVSFD